MTTTRSVVGIGASAGGIQALVSLLRDVPPDLPAAVLVVLHVSPSSPGVLSRILSRATRMPVSDAVDGTALRPGNVYLAPPDRHMIVGQERIHLSDGQHEKGRRPAVDPLLRSMAMTFGPRTIGVVLSGDLDDGVAGLLAVHRAGGVTVVQSPDDARCPGMPGAAVKAVPVDHVVPVSSMGALLARLARRAHADDGVERRARSRALCCPDCGGALVPDGVEQAMWAALRALEDRVSSRRRMAEHARSSRLPLAARGYEGSAAEDERRVQMLRSVLRNGG